MQACQLRAQLAPLGDDTLRFLIAQPVGVIDALRARFKDPHLYVYDPASKGRSLIELGAKG